MTDDLTLSFTRTLSASPANIWRCWTEPELMKQWFAPKPVVTTVAEIDAKPGGRFRTVMIVPDHGEMAGDAGCFLVVDQNKWLVWTNALGPDFRPNAFDGGPMSFPFTAEILLVATQGGCTYTATVLHATKAATEAHEKMGFYAGWGTATDQLDALASGL